MTFQVAGLLIVPLALKSSKYPVTELSKDAVVTPTSIVWFWIDLESLDNKRFNGHHSWPKNILKFGGLFNAVEIVGK